MNALLQRFFDRTVSPYDGQEYMLSLWQNFRFSDGRFRIPASDGESYDRFSVVYDMTPLDDGSYEVKFQVYSLSLEIYWNTPGIDDKYYHLDNDGAAALVWGEQLWPEQGGLARVRPYVNNGRATYQLMSYETWDIEFAMP